MFVKNSKYVSSREVVYAKKSQSGKLLFTLQEGGNLYLLSTNSGKRPTEKWVGKGLYGEADEEVIYTQKEGIRGESYQS